MDKDSNNKFTPPGLFVEKTLQDLKVASKDIDKQVEKWVLDRIPIFIYFDDYGRLRTRIHLPEYIDRKQAPNLDPETKSLVRTQSALFEWAKLNPVEIRTLGVPKAESEAQEAVERRKAERDRILESASYYLPVIGWTGGISAFTK